MTDDLLPFPTRPLARTRDPATSHQAGAAILPQLGRIQRLVLEVYRQHGPMSARQAEKREEFSGYGFSTIRKRISELAAEGYLRACGEERDGRSPATVYEVTR